MSLFKNTVNPLSVLGLRKVSFLPHHFKKIVVSSSADIIKIEQWICYRLESRYALHNTFALDYSKKMVNVVEIGLEDPREVTMLALACPYIHNLKELI